MKPGDACRLFQVTIVSLYNSQKEGHISGYELPNGFWNWEDESIYCFFKKDIPRVNHANARVSSNTREHDFKTQIHLSKQWNFFTRLQLNGLFSNGVSGISLKKRKNLKELIQEVHYLFI